MAGRRKSDARGRGAALTAQAATTWNGFSTPQKVITALLAVGLIGGAVLVSQYVSRPALTPLYSNLSGTDAAAIVDELTAAGISYELTDGGATVLVPRDTVYDQRIAMSAAGLPDSSESGYSLLDEQGVTTSQFQQQIAFQRAMEGELARTIVAIDGVDTAVVHLAIPAKDVFLDEQKTPTASVLVDTVAGEDLSGDQVRSIVHLVSSSVEALPADAVTVVDGAGRLLSAPGMSEAGGGDQLEATDTFEAVMADDLQRMLDTVLGPGNAIAAVAADLTFDETEATVERFVNDEAVPPLSESTTTEDYAGTGSAVGGVLGPDNISVPVGAGGGENTYTKETSTVNNAVGKVTERTVSAPGTVQRLSVSVVIDEQNAGTVDLTRLSESVSAAAGLDTQRGDTISVTRMAFDTTEAAAVTAELDAAKQAESSSDQQSLIRTAALAALVVTIVVISLIMGRRRKPTVDVIDISSFDDGSAALERAREMAALDAAFAASKIDVGRERAALASAARAEEVSDLVQRQPDEVAELLRTWLADRRT